MNESVADWFSKAQALANDLQKASRWRIQRPNNSFSVTADPPSEDINRWIREANDAVEAWGDAILSQVGSIQNQSISLGGRFDEVQNHLTFAYAVLRDFETPGLPVARCAWPVLSELVLKVSVWGWDIAACRHSARGIVFQTWDERETFLRKAIADIKTRLLLEHSQIQRDIANAHHPLVIPEAKGETPMESTLTKSQRLDASFVAALKAWHRFDPLSMTCSEAEPIPHETLAAKMEVGKGGTPKNKIAKFFGSQDEYEALCKDLQALAAKLATIDDTRGINKRLAETLAGVNAKLRKAKSEGFLDDAGD